MRKKNIFFHANKMLTTIINITVYYHQECEDPSMWENFPLKLTLDNCGSFLTTERSKRSIY